MDKALELQAGGCEFNSHHWIHHIDALVFSPKYRNKIKNKFTFTQGFKFSVKKEKSAD